jgi:predicted Ser/Thr protein kinase
MYQLSYSAEELEARLTLLESEEMQAKLVDATASIIMSELIKGVFLKDDKTDKNYKLTVSEGKLTMEESLSPTLEIINGSEVSW